jgi:hypothetical protein
MINELNNLINPINTVPEEQNIFLSKYTSQTNDGIKDLFEAHFYRETCLAQEKQNSSLLTITLDKLIKAMAPVK